MNRGGMSGMGDMIRRSEFRELISADTSSGKTNQQTSTAAEPAALPENVVGCCATCRAPLQRGQLFRCACGQIVCRTTKTSKRKDECVSLHRAAHRAANRLKGTQA